MTENNAIQTEPVEIDRIAAYRDWLGVTNPTPTYYEVLGLVVLECDSAAIFEAGREAKRKLRSYQVGRYKRQALELLAEVGQAVSVLTNPEKKRGYDNQLLKGWIAGADELFQKHCVGHTGEAAALEAWVNACRARGIPVARLLPWIVRRIRKSAIPWPAQGSLGLDLMTSLWIYRDVVVLGQCIESTELSRRVRAVKRVQQYVGVPSAVALVVAEDVTRARGSFEWLALVKEAKKSPDVALLHLARRIHRLGGHASHRSKVLLSVAAVLGKKREDLEKALSHIDEPPVDLPPARQAALVAKKAKRSTQAQAVQFRYWIEEHPQLLVAAAVTVAVAFLAMASLAATGVWSPWRPRPSDSSLPSVKENTAATPAEKPPARPAPGEGDPSKTPGTQAKAPAKGTGLEEFMKMYPSKPGEEEAVKPPEPAAPAETEEPKHGFFGVDKKPAKPKEKPKNDDAPTKFFGVPAEPRTKG